MSILLKARKVLKIQVLLQLYHSFVFPYLIYCSEVRGTASDIHIQPLIILQKKIVRIISFSRYNSPTKLLFQQYNILPFKKLVFHRLGLQLYKYEFSIIPIALRSLFTKNIVRQPNSKIDLKWNLEFIQCFLMDSDSQHHI